MKTADSSASQPRNSNWYGALGTETDAEFERKVAQLCVAAKGADWGTVLSMLDPATGRLSPNVWNPLSKSFFSPLHHAAWHGAPIPVIEALCTKGAWKYLKDAKGRTPFDVASHRGHDAVAKQLVPRPWAHVGDLWSDQCAERLDQGLASVISEVLGPDYPHSLRMPQVDVLAEAPDRPMWFAIPGVTGGFRISLRRRHLFTECWSRVGAIQDYAHVITMEDSIVVDQDFVD